MCGIVTIFHAKPEAGPPSREELRALRDHMASRGPDGSGEWFSPNGHVALGHRRLAILDLTPAGSQPMVAEDGSAAIVFNGEIYNFHELRSELMAAGVNFVSNCDTEVILRLYLKDGMSMLSRLRGMFAFAIWDEGRKKLLLARDPYGIKPLYYSSRGGRIVAASQVKTLALAQGVDTSSDPAGHAGFFLWGHVPEPYTLYRGIRAVPAGTFLEFESEGRASETRYSSVPEAMTQSTARGITSASDRRAALREVLRDSVKAHLLSDVPVGLFLSSGIDSTAVATLAAGMGGRLHSVTLGFEEYRGTPQDETPLAEQVAMTLGLQHDTVWVRREEFDEDREKLLAAMDQPSINGVNSYFVSKAAAAVGMKVALSGLGGDELFGGYPSFRQIPRSVGLLRTLRPVPFFGRAVRRVTAPLLSRLTSPKFASLLEHGPTWGGAYLLRRALYMPWELSQVMGAELAEEGLRELATLERLSETETALPDAWGKVMALESCWYMRNQLLRDTDWASMAHSLEVRVPFVDLALSKAVRSLAAGGEPVTKREVAAAMGDAMPSAVGLRKKTGFSFPIRSWYVRSSDSLQERGLRGWAKLVYHSHATKKPRVLVSTIDSRTGGVRRMLDFACRVLVDEGYEPVVSYYKPYSIVPHLSVPFFRLPLGGPKMRQETAGEREASAVGAWLPELEFTQYLPTKHWRNLVNSCQVHLCVSGNCLPALPYAATGVPFVAWIASPWKEDRQDRVAKSYPWYRRILDRVVIQPIVPLIEKKVLRRGHVLALSTYTSRSLQAIAGEKPSGVLTMPIDADVYREDASRVVEGRLGFAARLNDPRKNVGLIVEALHLLRRLNLKYHVFLMGGPVGKQVDLLIDALGLRESVTVLAYLEPEELVKEYRQVDVFVLPSYQEGLCIAALEAMACGCPVVSTRCGGPEEFVRDGYSGYLTGFSAADVAAKIAAIVSDRNLRGTMSVNARGIVQNEYSYTRSREVLSAAVRELTQRSAEVQ